MRDGSDFIISVHALDRFQERFPSLWQNDDDAGMFIYKETMEAMDAGRVASVPPLELSTFDPARWVPGKSKIAWTQTKDRGYVLVNGEDGLTVATVLVGQTSAEARTRMYSHRKTKTRRQRK